MICYVDMEHEKVFRDPQLRPMHLARRTEVMYRLGEIAGDACLMQRFHHVDPERLHEWNIRAVVISGCSTDWIEYSEESLAGIRRVVQEVDMPILGICGGHQLIAETLGGELGPVRALEAGEVDVAPHVAPGCLKEWGFTPVHVVQDDPILEGLGSAPEFLEAHYWEIKSLPAGFEVLASTPNCRVQLMRHTSRPIYGTQFHPEGYTEQPFDRRTLVVDTLYPEGFPEPRPAGHRLLANFFRIAGIRG